MLQWKLYKEALVDNNVFNSSYWYDIKGNHDCVYTDNHDYFQTYSVTGASGRMDGNGIYKFEYRTATGKYRFIGLNTVNEICIFLF